MLVHAHAVVASSDATVSLSSLPEMEDAFVSPRTNMRSHHAVPKAVMSALMADGVNGVHGASVPATAAQRTGSDIVTWPSIPTAVASLPQALRTNTSCAPDSLVASLTKTADFLVGRSGPTAAASALAYRNGSEMLRNLHGAMGSRVCIPH